MWDHTETMRAAPIAVINQSMARQYWPNGDAIGHQFRTPDLIDQTPAGAPSAPGSTGWLQIIGIVADSLDDGLRSPIRPAIYVPYSLHLWGFSAHPGEDSRRTAVYRQRRAIANRQPSTQASNWSCPAISSPRFRSSPNTPISA